MAQLRNLGMPFGSPGGIINIPAPAGSALAGQIQMRSMEGLGQALGQYLGQQRQQELWQQDMRNMQLAQQSQLPQGMAGPQMGMPQMQSRMAQQAQMQSQLGQMFPAPADPFSLAPGAQRFTGAGKFVAGVPEISKPMPFTLTPGAQRFTETGERIAKVPITPTPLTPTQRKAQAQLDVYNKAKAVPSKQRTELQQAIVDNFETGKPFSSSLEKEYKRAQIDAARALAEERRRTTPFTLTPGAGRFTGAGQLVAEREPAPMLPTQKAAQAKLDAYNKAKAIPVLQRTKHQQAVVEKYELGQALVQINLGRASPTERTKIAETRASIDALNNIKELYDSAKTRTGMVVGRLDPVLGLFGLTTNEQEDFMAATSAFRNQIIKEITGAQMSEVEAKRILKQVPQEKDPPARWEAKWKQSKKNLEMLQKRRLEILRQSGLQVPMGQTINIENMTDEELRKIAGEQ